MIRGPGACQRVPPGMCHALTLDFPSDDRARLEERTRKEQERSLIAAGHAERASYRLLIQMLARVHQRARQIESEALSKLSESMHVE